MVRRPDRAAERGNGTAEWQPTAEVDSIVSSPAVENVVHVTIGRIEVRATPITAVDRRARPAKAAISLSDYLDKRERGEGR